MSINSKKKKILILLLIILIIFIIYITTLFTNSKNKAKIDEIKQYNYFTIYENEKYGVIDKSRKHNYRA